MGNWPAVVFFFYRWRFLYVDFRGAVVSFVEGRLFLFYFGACF